MGIMRRRMRRRLVVGGAAAGAVAYHEGKKHQQRDDEEQDEEQATEYAPEPSASAGPDDAALDEIKKLADLHESGALTDDEFASAKAKLLA